MIELERPTAGVCSERAMEKAFARCLLSKEKIETWRGLFWVGARDFERAVRTDAIHKDDFFMLLCEKGEDCVWRIEHFAFGRLGRSLHPALVDRLVCLAQEPEFAPASQMEAWFGCVSRTPVNPTVLSRRGPKMCLGRAGLLGEGPSKPM